MGESLLIRSWKESVEPKIRITIEEYLVLRTVFFFKDLFLLFSVCVGRHMYVCLSVCLWVCTGVQVSAEA